MDRDTFEKFAEVSGRLESLKGKVEEFGKKLEKTRGSDLDKNEVLAELEELKTRLAKVEKAKVSVRKKKTSVGSRKGTLSKTKNE